jgi:hypothetical protein
MIFKANTSYNYHEFEEVDTMEMKKSLVLKLFGYALLAVFCGIGMILGAISLIIGENLGLILAAVFALIGVAPAMLLLKKAEKVDNEESEDVK